MPKSFPPGPSGRVLTGNMFDLSGDRLGFLLRLNREYGDIVHFRVGPARHVYMLNNPDYIREVLVSQPEHFHKGPVLKQNAKEAIGEGLLTSEDEFHKRQRRLVQPAFHTSRIASYGEVMVDHTLRMLQDWQPGQQRELHHEMMKLTLGIVAKTLFDADVSDQADQIGQAITVGIHYVNDRMTHPLRLPDWLPTPQNQKWRSNGELLDQIIMNIIEQRRASGEDKGDLLSMLLLAIDEEAGEGMAHGMSDKQARDEAMTLFIAGHETTANALSWMWYLLAQHPEVEAKLMAELDSVLAGRAPTVHDLPRLPYTDMIAKEAMRLYPPAWLLTRQAVDDIQIGGYDIPKGSMILMSQYAMHHDPRFFPEPERFDPERFTPEREKQLPRYAYFPFGGGPRVCIGQSFAMMEARLILATMAQHYHLSLVPGQKVEMEPLITLRPKPGIQVHLHGRREDGRHEDGSQEDVALSSVEPAVVM